MYHTKQKLNYSANLQPYSAPQNVKHRTITGPSKSTPRYVLNRNKNSSHKNLHRNFSSTVNSQTVETTQMDKQNVVSSIQLDFIQP